MFTYLITSILGIIIEHMNIQDNNITFIYMFHLKTFGVPYFMTPKQLCEFWVSVCVFELDWSLVLAKAEIISK